MSDPIYVSVRWHRPEFHGLRDDGSVDWPPSPLRLSAALTNGAYQLPPDRRDAALVAIDRLMGAPAPIIWCSSTQDLELPDTYTQKSGLDAAGRGSSKHMKDFLDLSLVQMDTKSRTRKPVDGIALDVPAVIFEVVGDWEPEQVAVLDDAARHVGYFGRSYDPAELSVSLEKPLALKSLDPWRPSASTSGRTRGWTPRSREWMDVNYERLFGEGQSSHLPLPPLPAAGFMQPLRYWQLKVGSGLEVLPLSRSIPSHLIPYFMKALLGEASPVGDKVQVFPAVNAGHWKSDGRCLGLGFASAASGGDAASRDELFAVASELGARLGDTDLGKFQIGPVPQESSWTLNPDRWSASASDWISATPYRGFPDAMVVRHAIATEVAERFGAQVTVTRADTTPSARWEHRWSQQLHADGLTDWWVSLQFAAPIPGPLLLHNGQAFGSGLFVGLGEERGRHHG